MVSITDQHDLPISTASMAAGGNVLLGRMTTSDLELLATSCRRRRVPYGFTLADAGQPPSFIYFIEYGVASIVTVQPEGRRTEIALVGRETFVGVPAVIGDGRWPYRTFVQTDQLCAVEIPVSAIQVAMSQSTTLASLLMRSVQATLVQIAEGLVSASWQRLDARLARWLLMYRDRLQSERIAVTHEFMALMVGVQRTGITEALHALEDQGLIAATRGLVVIRDAERLMLLAGQGYGVSEREHARIVAGSATPVRD